MMYRSLLVAFLVALLSACSSSDRSIGAVSFQSVNVVQGGQSVKAIQLVDEANDIEISWDTYFISASTSYSISVWLGTNKTQKQRKLFERNCSVSADGQYYDCADSHTYLCSLEDNVVDCQGNMDGFRQYIDKNMELIYFEACVFDFYTESGDKDICDTTTLQLNTFTRNDIRLEPFDGVIPAEWLTNGMPLPACESSEDNELVGCYYSETCYTGSTVTDTEQAADTGTESSRYWVDIQEDGIIKTYKYEYATSATCTGPYTPSLIKETAMSLESGEAVFFKDGEFIDEPTSEDLEGLDEDEYPEEAIELNITLGEDIDPSLFSIYRMENFRLCLPSEEYSWHYTANGLNLGQPSEDERLPNINDEDCLLKQ